MDQCTSLCTPNCVALYHIVISQDIAPLPEQLCASLHFDVPGGRPYAVFRPEPLPFACETMP